MLRKEKKQYSFYSGLYEKIPSDHLLKQIDEAVDFSFINELLESSYCAKFGRPAKEPEMMMKILFLQNLYNLSDVRIIEESKYNLAHLWFLGLNPEDELPDPSLLAKFRTQRLKDEMLDEVISEIVRQCVEKGIIKGDSISVDSTHLEANCKKKSPEKIMKYLAVRLFKSMQKDLQEIPSQIDTQIPESKEIKDVKEARKVMKNYLEKVIDEAQKYPGENIKAAIDEARELISDERFMNSKSVRSLSDKDARVGHKSKTDCFFGYKTEFTMTTEERIITALVVGNGAYVDGTEFKDMLEKTIISGMDVNEAYGDKAYFRKDILADLKEKKIVPYIPVSRSAYRVDEEMYSYNKDSDQWFCCEGNNTISKKVVWRKRDGKKEMRICYKFDNELCGQCPKAEQCKGFNNNKVRKGAKTLVIGEYSTEFYEISRWQKNNKEFLEKYKKRAGHEWKNGELKRFHGLAKAKGWCIQSVIRQAKLTAIAGNLKRIAAIKREELSLKTAKSFIFSFFEHFKVNNLEKMRACC